MDEPLTTGHTLPQALVIPKGISFVEYRALGFQLRAVESGVRFWLGDWLVYGKEHFPKRYDKITIKTRLRKGSLYDCCWVARRIPPHRRRPELTWTHHKIAAEAPTEARQDELLQMAVDKQLNTRQLRNELRGVGEEQVRGGLRLLGGRGNELTSKEYNRLKWICGELVHVIEKQNLQTSDEQVVIRRDWGNIRIHIEPVAQATILSED